MPETDYDRYFEMASAAFGETLTPTIAERERSVLEPGRSLAAYEGDRVVSGVAAVSMKLPVPGGIQIPCAGVTAVATSPTHRRRGLARRLLQRQLEDVHERGEPLAYLWASEAAIYQRFGYGLGSWAGAFHVDKHRVSWLDDRRPAGRIRLIDQAEALKVFPDIYDRATRERPGAATRASVWWDVRITKATEEAGTQKRLSFAVYENDEGADGYSMYTIEEDWSHRGGANNHLEILEMVTASDDAYLGMWRYSLEADLVGRISGWLRPVDEPLLYLVAEPRALGFQLRDGTWLRLVDVPAALEARRYSAEGRLILRVRDATAEWNDGTYELDGGPDGATSKRTDGEPDLEMDVNALASAYLGTVSFRSLRSAGRVREVAPGAVERADAMFASAPAPWCPWIF